jgi:ABC-type Fe3+ transport system permease subunit
MVAFFSVSAIVAVVATVFCASLLLERLTGRSRTQFRKPGWFLVFFGLFIPGVVAVYSYVTVTSAFLYGSYGLAAGLAGLIAQCFYGLKLPAPSEQAKNE